MCNIYELSTIFANIIVMGGGIFAVYQYRKQKKLTRISNAIDIAKYFSTNIVDKACLVYTIFCGCSEIMDIINKHETEIKNAKYFNQNEYNTIFEEKERRLYKVFLMSSVKIDENNQIVVSEILQDVINQLEHCSISFNSGLAEDTAVYQSMHQVIFQLFPCVYPWIGDINKSSVDLYYTNLCELYVRWNKIREKAIYKENKAMKKLENYRKKQENTGRVMTPKI